jgi:hypothetical protein
MTGDDPRRQLEHGFARLEWLEAMIAHRHETGVYRDDWDQVNAIRQQRVREEIAALVAEMEGSDA